MPTIDATCWFLKPTQPGPSHSPRVTRMTRKTSCTTVSTMTTNAPKPSAVPTLTGINSKVATFSRLPTPAANAPAPASPPVIATAVNDSSPSVFSLNIPPPPTGSASVSYSSCRAVPTDPNSACHPEIAPHAIVTNSIGHSGWIGPATGEAWNCVNPGILNSATSGETNAAITAPTAARPIVSAVIQKPM